MQPLASARLYTFVDTAYLDGRDPAGVTRELCLGGSDLIQVRAKDASPAATRALTEQVMEVAAEFSVPIVVNDHPQLAAELKAPWCHLGQEDFFDAGHQQAADVTQTHGFRLGLSTHSTAQAARAIQAGADYIAIGPVFATGTKPTARPVTLAYVQWAAAHVAIPWFAIGGIHLGNLDEVIEAGARRICVVSAILRAPDIAGACQAFRQRLLSAPL